MNGYKNNQGGVVARRLQTINRALLYVIVSIFIGNLFVGAILDNTPRAKAEPAGTQCVFKQKGETEPIRTGLWRVTVMWTCSGDPLPDFYRIRYQDDDGYRETDPFRGPLEKTFDMKGDGPFYFTLFALKGNDVLTDASLVARPAGACTGIGDEVARVKQRVDAIEAAANTINPDDPNSIYSAVAEAYIFKKKFLADYCHIANAMDSDFADPNQYRQLHPDIKAQIVRYQKIINEKIELAQENIKNMQYLKDFNTGEITDLPVKPPKGWAPESYRKGIDDLIKTRYPAGAIIDKMNGFVDAIAEGNSDALKGQAGVAKTNIANRWVAVVRGAISLFTFNPAGLGQAVIGEMAADWNTQLVGGKISQEVKNKLNEAMNALIIQSQGTGEDGNGYEVGLYSFYDLYLKAYGAATDITNPPGSDANAECKEKLFAGIQMSTWFQDAICEMLNLMTNTMAKALKWIADEMDKVGEVSRNLIFTKAYAVGEVGLRDMNHWSIKGWKTMLNLVNIIVIIVLLLIAFSNILRINIDIYTIKKSLPLLVLGVILANFSLLISRMLTDLSELLAKTFISEGGGILGPIKAMGIRADALTIGGISAFIMAALVGGWGFVVGGLFFIAIFVGIVILWVMLWARTAVIFFLVAIAPLAFISIALPFGSGYFRKWWGLFITWVFMWPVIYFIFWIASKISAEGIDLINLMVVGALIYAAIMLPFTWGGQISRVWGRIGSALARVPAKGAAAISGKEKIAGIPIKDSWIGKGLKAFGTYGDPSLLWHTTKKAWETLEEDRTTVAQREALGNFIFRRANPNATRTSVFKRMSDYEKFDSDSLIKMSGVTLEEDSSSPTGFKVTGQEYKTMEDLAGIKGGDEFHTKVGTIGAELKQLEYLRRLPAYRSKEPGVMREANMLYTALRAGPAAGLVEKGNITSWGKVMPIGPTPMGGWKNPAKNLFYTHDPTKPLERPDAQGQMVRYGQYNPETGEMDIDFEAARGAWGQVAPELGEADAHKVTGFVHAHEAFHDIAANKLSPEQQVMLKTKDTSGQVLEEKLADAYARQAFDLGDEPTKARDRKALDDFKAQLPEDSRGLMDLKYEGEGDNNLLLGLHRAGLEYGKISDKRLAGTPTHAVAEAPSPAPVAEGAPAAGSAPALTKEEQEEEVRKNAYIGGVREEYHRETEKIIEKAPEDAAGSKLLDDDKTLRVARLITGRLTVRPNEEQRYNHALYESSLQGVKGAEQKLRVALEQPTVGASKAKVEGIVQAVRTVPATQLSQKLQTEYQITPEIQARLKPDIQGFTEAVNFKNVVSHRLANEALDVTQPMRANLTARLQKGDIDWTGLDRIQSELKTQEQKLSLGRVAPAELDAAYKTLVRIHPAAQIQIEGAKSQPELLSKIKQSRAAIGQLSTPEIRRAMESGGSTQQVEAKIRQNYQAKFEVQHNLDQINKAMSDAVRSVRISRPNLTNEQVSMDLERRVTENVRIKDLIERVTRVDPVYKETVVSGVARKIAPQYAKNPSYKIDAGAISQISDQELRRVASAPRPAPRASIARPASQPIAKPMNDIRPIPEKPSPSQWETQKVESIIATKR